MKAFVLAGGFGTRLRPITYVVPKPMLPHKEKPLLEHWIRNLRSSGIRDIILCVGYLAYQIKDHFRDGKRFGVNIKYTEENKPMGTAGCLNLARDEIDDTFLLIGGDNVTDMKLADFIRFHRRKKGTLSVALFEYEEKVKWGIYEIDRSQRISRFREKPSFRHLAGTMMFCCEPKILDYIPRKPKGIVNLTDHVIPKMMKAREKIYGFPFKEDWIDIGSMADYEKLIGKK